MKCKNCGKTNCKCNDDTFEDKKVGKKAIEKKNNIAKKMSGEGSLKSHGRNEGENMMNIKGTEWNRS